MKLTDTLDFNPDQPLAQQAADVQRFVAGLLATPPTTASTQQCGELVRPVLQVWQVGQAEVVQYHEYAHEPTHAACFAKKSTTLTLRPRLV